MKTEIRIIPERQETSKLADIEKILSVYNIGTTRIDYGSLHRAVQVTEVPDVDTLFEALDVICRESGIKEIMIVTPQGYVFNVKP